MIVKVLVILTAFLVGFFYFENGAQADEKFLDKVQKEAFDYFWNETNPKTGFTSNTSERSSPASNAAAGFMLSALPIGIERGWITGEEGYERALTALKSFRKIETFHGFTYHYFNKNTGQRMWASEVSSIDTGLFLAGVITIGEYFKGTEVEKLADEIFKKIDWQWFLDGENVLQMAWKPERGFFARIDVFSEGILSYILAMGSPTHPIPADCWDSFLRPVSKYGDYELIYASDGGLFQYLFPLAWLDLVDKHDKYADYWQNAIVAIKANRQYCRDNADKHQTYKMGFWGLSASLSPRGYKAFGAKPGKNIDDGTVAPYVVGGSIPLTPEISVKEYRMMYEKNPRAVKKYGLVDAFNIGENWVSSYYISIDKGLTLLMIENYRSGLIWKYFMQNKYVKVGMRKAGFESGRQYKPSKSVYLAGNPHDSVKVKKLKRQIKIDGDLSEWNGASLVTLTTKNNKNVEITHGYVKDDSDASGTFYLGWDEENLYIAGKVSDNELVCTEINGKIYLDDCVEVFFDVNKNGYYFDKNAYDYQFAVAPYGPGETSRIWAWGYRNKEPENIRYAVRFVKGGYTVEMAIPFDEINGFRPVKGEDTGFSISIHDRDANNKTKKLTWSIDSTSQPGKIFFGTLSLVD
ncbi:MAG: hypothetical protein ISS92_01980 [Candidatus Omnitrophica bacterium]|nr:hypothetical protein [Candidatus Omnitrophota bacterium]